MRALGGINWNRRVGRKLWFVRVMASWIGADCIDSVLILQREVFFGRSNVHRDIG